MDRRTHTHKSIATCHPTADAVAPKGKYHCGLPCSYYSGFNIVTYVGSKVCFINLLTSTFVHLLTRSRSQHLLYELTTLAGLSGKLACQSFLCKVNLSSYKKPVLKQKEKCQIFS